MIELGAKVGNICQYFKKIANTFYPNGCKVADRCFCFFR